MVETGMGVVSVFGNDVDHFYTKLLEGQSGATFIDRFDASTFTVRFAAQIKNFFSAGYTDSKNDCRLDDCWRYCLVATKKALESADLGSEILQRMDKTKMGVVVGTGVGGLPTYNNKAYNIARKGFCTIAHYFISCPITSIGSSLCSIEFGLMGPTYSISTACPTSNCCLYFAANHIRNGDADAGGTEAPIVPTGIAGFIACKALSTRNFELEKASRPWDRDRDGFVMGEGSGILVMESLEHARKRGTKIIAEYLWEAIACDAHHATNPHLDGLGVTQCIQMSLNNAGVSPEERIEFPWVNYVNAHATSTPAGDLAEVNVLKKLFKDTSKSKMM